VPLQTPSRQVSSNQLHLHPRLCSVVRRHLATEYRKPVARHSLAAFKELMTQLGDGAQALILDSFCGTGQSTATLAQRHPEHLVVGIDKSSQRLGRHPSAPCDNYLLLQADCEDIWRLLAQEGVAVDYHYLLYPNPWPKAKHLQRRVHGHGSFPLLLQLGGRASRGRIELRSNWQTYVEEFGLAMHLAGCRGRVAQVPAGPHLTLFEQKYRLSEHALWAFVGYLAP
jgi:tRNA (guanine-N7-)-methyltransferase